VCLSMSICAVLLLLHGYCHGLQSQQTTFDNNQNQANSLLLGSELDSCGATSCNTARRNLIRQVLGVAMTTAVLSSSPSLSSAATTANDDSVRHPFVYSDSWTGTRIKIVSLEDATHNGAYTTEDSGLYWTMGKWPDPALRIPAKRVDPAMWLGGASSEQHQKLQLGAAILRDTANREGAVGLAAQQCGVDARMVYLSASSGIFGNPSMVLVNPRIVARSPESNMKVWTEECLVLPPTFRATVLRDEWIDVEYDLSYEYRSLVPSSSFKELTFSGDSNTPIRRRFVNEQSRCLQHELDHDRGILITDHVGLDELENNAMRRIEAEGHDRRQTIAYSRQ